MAALDTTRPSSRRVPAKAPDGWAPRRRIRARVELNPRSWGTCSARVREHWHWLIRCADCGKAQPS